MAKTTVAEGHPRRRADVVGDSASNQTICGDATCTLGHTREEQKTAARKKGILRKKETRCFALRRDTGRNSRGPPPHSPYSRPRCFGQNSTF
ncbi:hypothetical protein L596_015686 [Steinernema carpocapsae]|uniref:Uncharacterized protein n=1 Tax=Steinernema carpocapsae TaxID=34508 RepID=A0A4U5NGK5_STECR|nr:hypothetical protein L596_015686 [Steinernema carpocapsae]